MRAIPVFRATAASTSSGCTLRPAWDSPGM
jgi:hypothetical protein